ncbi:MAG: hypothetical protein JSV80_13170, partial [Acidobacteriota bacterium]
MRTRDRLRLRGGLGMVTRTRFVLSLLTVLFCLSAHESTASVLTFDLPFSDGDAVDESYGDRIDGVLVGEFSYGSDGGFTPRVLVDYGPEGASPSLWSSGYGELDNVLYKGRFNVGALEVALRAGAGWTVV